MVTSTIYIGKTERDFEVRWKEHRRKEHNKHLAAAIKEYGIDAFEFVILEETEDLPEAEQFWYEYFKYIGADLYNLLEPKKEHKNSYRATEANRKNRSEVHSKRWRDEDYKEAHLSNMNICGFEEGWKRSREDRIAHSPAKTYTVIDPQGQVITFTNARKFARNNGLNEQGFSKILTGARPHYKQWRKAA